MRGVTAFRKFLSETTFIEVVVIVVILGILASVVVFAITSLNPAAETPPVRSEPAIESSCLDIPGSAEGEPKQTVGVYNDGKGGVTVVINDPECAPG